MKMTRKYLILGLIFTVIVFIRCGVFEPDKTPGSLRIVLQSSTSSGLEKASGTLSSVECIVKKGSETKYDANLTNQGGSFHGEITGLEPANNYSVLLYGKNSSGDIMVRATRSGITVSAGEQAEVIIAWNLGTVTDIDGNTYQTIKIGNQWWMMENLKVTHYRNGDAIPNVTDNTEWTNLTTGAYCNYNNNSANVATYGRLYNWYAVNDSRNIAPAGWHVPTNAEWQTLVDYLGGNLVAGGKMKEVGTAHWDSPNAGATNESGFSALPGGLRSLYGDFWHVGRIASLWPSTEYYYDTYSAWRWILDSTNSEVNCYVLNKGNGLSLRCVRD